MNIKKFAITGLAGASIVTMAAAPVLASNTKTEPQDHKVGICHATGSKTNPYVFIVVDEHAEKAHASHQDGRDIVDAKSAADCPKPVIAHTQPSQSPAPAGKGQVLSTATQSPA